MGRIILILTYLYWCSWAVIVGGVLLITLLAPIAFFTLPPLTSDSTQAVLISGKLVTLLIGRFVPICTMAFWFLTVLELRHIKREWLFHSRVRFFLQAFLFLITNLIWAYLAFFLIPEMQETVLNQTGTTGLSGSTKAVFRQQHEWGSRLIFLCFAVTLFVPYFQLTRIRGTDPSAD
ncbi:MAG: hypothetical protein HQM13_00605 [SAR324 cluster bacterium]|nr:hypothetical protein [SAR324 cluster bacterium]